MLSGHILFPLYKRACFFRVPLFNVCKPFDQPIVNVCKPFDQPSFVKYTTNQSRSQKENRKPYKRRNTSKIVQFPKSIVRLTFCTKNTTFCTKNSSWPKTHFYSPFFIYILTFFYHISGKEKWVFDRGPSNGSNKPFFVATFDFKSGQKPTKSGLFSKKHENFTIFFIKNRPKSSLPTFAFLKVGRKVGIFDLFSQNCTSNKYITKLQIILQITLFYQQFDIIHRHL